MLIGSIQNISRIHCPAIGIFAALNGAFQGPTFPDDSKLVEVHVRTCSKMCVCVCQSLKTQRNTWLMSLHFDVFSSGFLRFKLSCQV